MTRAGLDPADAGPDRALADDRHETDVAGAGRMGAAAEFDRIDRVRGAPPRLAPSHRDDPDFVAVFLAEQGARAAGACIVDRHEPRHDGLVLQDDPVGDLLDLRQFFRRDRLLVREVEAQPVAVDERSLLGDMRAQHLAERLVQQMGRRMVGPDGATAGVIDLRHERHAGSDGTLDDLDVMDEEIAELLAGIRHSKRDTRRRQRARVADLATGLAVERRLIEQELPGLAGRRAFPSRAPRGAAP